jgi:riboflavin synthase
MFTGIVEERGRVSRVGGGPGGRRIAVTAPKVSEGSPPGASVAVNGVCLTVVEAADGVLAFDLAQETLARSSLGSLGAGDHVNLERPVTLAGRLGGHLVQGHVDGVGTVEAVEPEGEGKRMRIRSGDGPGRYIVEKGSVALDGVSLTVAAATGDVFEVVLVPHTLAVTTLGSTRPGDVVNLEVDVIAKYVESLVGGRP